MIVDTSAWIEYLRATGSPAHRQLRTLIEGEHDGVVVPELVVMELCAGPTDERAAVALRRLLHRFEVVPVAPLVDTDLAASIQRQCRRAGEAVRSMIDCLIAAMAIRLDAPVLHSDRDFDVMARHTPLRITGSL